MVTGTPNPAGQPEAEGAERAEQAEAAERAATAEAAPWGSALRSAGLVLAAVGAAAVLVAMFLRWYAFGALPSLQSEPGGRTARALPWLLLIAVVLLLAYRAADPDRRVSPAWRVTGLVAAAGLTVTTLWQLNWLSPAWPLQPGGVLAGVGAVAVLAGMAALCLTPPRRRLGRPPAGGRWPAIGWRGGMLAAAALVVLAAVGAVGGVAAGRQVVDRATAAALPPSAVLAPADPGQVRWQIALGDDRRAVAASGQYLLLAHRDGVEVLDASTGRPRWHYYRRYDRYQFVAATLTDDKTTVVAVYRRPTGRRAASTLVVALDLNTGRSRWQWTQPTNPGEADALFPDLSGWRISGAQLIHIASPAHAVLDITGYDLQTGAVRWTHRFAPAAGCLPLLDSLQAVTRGVVAVGLECGNQNASLEQIQGFSAATGAPAWTWTAPPHEVPTLDNDTYGGDLAVTLGGQSSSPVQLLDAATGHPVRILDPNTAATLFDTTPILAVSGADQSTVTALDPAAGTTRWSGQIPGLGASTSHIRPVLAAYPTTGYLIGGSLTASVVIDPISLSTGHPGDAVRFPGRDIPDHAFATPGVLIVQTTPPADQPGPNDDTLYGLG